MSALPVIAVRPIAPERLAALRGQAITWLGGPGATHGPAARALDAMSVLHALASSPDTAPDALTLLHELQVHQVELDLQAQELQESRAELESELQGELALQDSLPVGWLTLDARLILQRLNRTGSELMGLAHGDPAGLMFDTFLCADSTRRLRTAMRGIDTGKRRTSCLLNLRPVGGPDRSVIASVAPAPEAGQYLVCLTIVGEPWA